MVVEWVDLLMDKVDFYVPMNGYYLGYRINTVSIYRGNFPYLPNGIFYGNGKSKISGIIRFLPCIEEWPGQLWHLEQINNTEMSQIIFSLRFSHCQTNEWCHSWHLSEIVSQYRLYFEKKDFICLLGNCKKKKNSNLKSLSSHLSEGKTKKRILLKFTKKPEFLR